MKKIIYLVGLTKMILNQNPNFLIKKGIRTIYWILTLAFTSVISGYFLLEFIDLYFEYELSLFQYIDPIKILVLLFTIFMIFIASLFIFFRTVTLYDNFTNFKLSGGLLLLLSGISLIFFSCFFPLLNSITFILAIISLFQLRKGLIQ